MRIALAVVVVLGCASLASCATYRNELARGLLSMVVDATAPESPPTDRDPPAADAEGPSSVQRKS